MKWITVFLGIVFIILGVLSLAYHGIPYTAREKIMVIGPVEATREVKKTIPLPPILGGPLLARGIAFSHHWGQEVIGRPRCVANKVFPTDICHETFRS
jgi:hypothetical protein